MSVQRVEGVDALVEIPFERAADVSGQGVLRGENAAQDDIMLEVPFGAKSQKLKAKS